MSHEQLKILQAKIVDMQKLLKIDELKKKMETLASEMNRPDFWNDQQAAQAMSQDYQSIKDEVEKWSELESRVNDLLDLSAAGDDSLQAEIAKQATDLEGQYADYEFYLLLNGPYDQKNAIVAIHAGSGGTEAQDWAEMLTRMFFRFSEQMGWQTKVIDESRGAEAGYKSIMFEVKGHYAYGYLKSEHGVHRLVRISPFDAEKMRHTSFALVEVLP